MKVNLMLSPPPFYKLIVCLLLTSICGNRMFAQSCDPACEDLSNLTVTTHINAHLLPQPDRNIGSADSSWSDYFMNGIFYIEEQGVGDDLRIMMLNGHRFLHTTGNATGMESPTGLFLGEYAGEDVDATSNGCVGIGYRALEQFVSTDHNTAVGFFAMSAGDAGDKNTMVGNRAGQNIDGGDSNTGIGQNVFYRSGTITNYIEGIGNVGIGATSDNIGVFGNLYDGNYNTAVGFNSVKSLTTGDENTILGYNAGADLTFGDQNIFIGSGASSGDNGTTNGTGNIVIGINEDLHSSSASNRMNIGGVLYADLSANKVSIGNSGSALSNTFNVGANDEFQIDNTGVIKEYNNLTTDGLGVPVILNVLTLSDQAGSITNGMLLEDAPAGVYRVTYQGVVTVAADVGSALSFKVRYTDADITSGTVDAPSTNITGNNSTTSNTVGSANFSGVVLIQVADASDIKYIVSRASESSGSMEYSLRVLLERIQ
ncbi:MAG: hypothetical protein H6546_06815 [Chitinophagales bacterium]|nr:hypothetical protein [Chitinophagales bacterium]